MALRLRPAWHTPHWDSLLYLLNDFNRGWTENAAALLIVLSKTTFASPGKSEELPAPTHSFNAGAAWGYLALHASLSGWHAHGMASFDKEKARSVLGLPAHFAFEVAVAIGKIGDRTTLPESLRPKEELSPRLPLQALVSEGKFKGEQTCSAPNTNGKPTGSSSSSTPKLTPNNGVRKENTVSRDAR